MRQSTSNIMMVRPASFQFNTETAESNEFQNNITDIEVNTINKTAQKEFDTMVLELSQNKIEVQVIEDTPQPVKPDAIFPNNWISMGPDGIVTIFPMKNENRQLEKRKDIIDLIHRDYMVQRTIDLSHFEKEDKALEGTGSIVFDHINKLAYACISPRTELSILESYCDEIGYKPITFHSIDSNGKLIYHTNVVMNIGDGYVVIGMDTMADNQERNYLKTLFNESGLEIVSLSNEQLLKHFAGNMLHVENQDGEPYLVMSARAYKSLTTLQKKQIEKYAQLLPVSIDIIETIGGGSARCMMAENFLEKK